MTDRNLVDLRDRGAQAMMLRNGLERFLRSHVSTIRPDVASKIEDAYGALLKFEIEWEESFR